jgi:hypothetical protein
LPGRDTFATFCGLMGGNSTIFGETARMVRALIAGGLFSHLIGGLLTWRRCCRRCWS